MNEQKHQEEPLRLAIIGTANRSFDLYGRLLKALEGVDLVSVWGRYDSPLRWWRSSRFLAEKGMGITVGLGLDVEERLSLLAPGGDAPRFIPKVGKHVV